MGRKKASFFSTLYCIWVWMLGLILLSSCTFDFEVSDSSGSSSNNDPNAPSVVLLQAPSLGTISSHKNPIAEFSIDSSVLTSLDHFECRINGGSWFTCTSPLDIMTTGETIPVAEYFDVDVVAVDLEGKRSPSQTQTVMLGVVPRGYNGWIEDLEILNDGQLVAAGGFTARNPEVIQSFLKINSDGSPDKTWLNVGSGFQHHTYDAPIRQFFYELDTGGNRTGKIFIGGQFTHYDGQDTPNGLIRLNADGTYDSTYNSGGSGLTSGSSGHIHTMIQELDLLGNPTGKLLIGGTIGAYNGDQSIPDDLIRLNADGTHDSTFNNGGSGFDGSVYLILPERDTLGALTGKLLVAGTYTTYNGTDVPDCLVRLNADGSWDSSFNLAGAGFTGLNSHVVDVRQEINPGTGLPTGNLIVAGSFDTFNGSGVPSRLIRLTSSGAFDSSFNNAGSGLSADVEYMEFELDTNNDYTGKILVGGRFSQYNGSSVPRALVRINADGSIDGTFNTGGTGFEGIVEYFYQERDTNGDITGDILVGGDMDRFNSSSIPVGLFRLNADGTASPNTVFAANDSGFEGTVEIIMEELGVNDLPTGKYLIGGPFASSSGIDIPNSVLRLTSAKEFDETFNAGQTGNDYYLQTILPEEDLSGNLTGKYLVGGQSYDYNGIDTPNFFFRINADGSPDLTFNIGGSGAGGRIEDIIMDKNASGQNTGKYLIANSSTAYNGNVVPDNLIRINSDGSHDTTFNTGQAGADDTVYSLVHDLDAAGVPNGKYWVGGWHQNYNGVNTPDRLILIDNTGAYDSSFNDGNTGFSYPVYKTVVELGLDGLPTGKLIVGGRFDTYNGLGTPNKLVRVFKNGTLDTTFNNGGVGFSNDVHDVIQEIGADGLPTGKVIVGGEFLEFNTNDCPNNLVRLNLDGSIDSSFNTGGEGLNGPVWSIAMDKDDQGNYTGEIIVGGEFQTYNGISVKSLLRVHSDGTLDQYFEGSGKQK